MNLLYSPGTDVDNWGYDTDTGIIPKYSGGSEHDAEQDQNIEANKEQIQETKRELRNTENVNVQQQIEIDSNTVGLEENVARDDRQQIEINANTENIIRIEHEIPTFTVQGTAIIIGKKTD